MAQREAIGRIAIINLDKVVGALLVVLYFECEKFQDGPMSWGRCETPYTIRLFRVRQRVIWTRYVAEGCIDFVLAAAFFAIAPILVQNVSIVAGAYERADVVPTLVHAAAIIRRTFVDVCDEYGGEATLLHRFIRTEFDAHSVAE